MGVGLPALRPFGERPVAGQFLAARAEIALVAAEKKVLIFCAENGALADGVFEQNVRAIQTVVNDPPSDRRDDDGLHGDFAGVEKEAVGPAGIISQLHAGGQVIVVLGVGGGQAKAQQQKHSPKCSAEARPKGAFDGKCGWVHGVPPGAGKSN